MDGRGRAVHAGFVLLAVPLVMLCALGEAWRFAAISAANLVPFAVLGIQLRRRTGTERRGWLVMVAGTGLLLVHNVHNQVAFAATGFPADGPLAAATMVLGYAFLLAGALLATIPYARRIGGETLDAAVIGLAAASLVWGAVLQPAHERLGSSAVTTGYEMSLVLLVTALTGTVVRAVVVARQTRAATLYLLLAMCATNLADVSSTLAIDPATRLTPWWVGALCVTALLAFSAALVHPSAKAIALPGRPPRGLTRARLVFLGGALAVNPALAATQQLLGHTVDVTLLSASSLVIVPLVVTRIGLLARWHADAVRRLHDLASLDELTGLPNRRATTAHLETTLARVADGAAPGAVVLYLDVDDFKSVNDEHGHRVGDLLLREVAARLRSSVRATDLVARIGGDEFIVVLEGTVESVEDVAVRAIELALAAPVTIGSVLTPGRVSIGVASVSPGERVDAESLLSRADAAMYRAKRAHSFDSAPTSPEPVRH